MERVIKMNKKYIETINKYIENAKNEPADTTSYVKGLEDGVYSYREAEDKLQLVLPLADNIEWELNRDEPDYEYIKGVVTCLREALKVEGDISKYLTKYHVVTPVDKLVKDGKGKVVPLQYLSTPEYDDVWTLPEILATDITYLEFAVELKGE